MIKTFLNPERNLNRISGLKVTAMLLEGWILPIGGASLVEGLRSTGLPRLVYNNAGLFLCRLFSGIVSSTLTLQEI